MVAMLGMIHDIAVGSDRVRIGVPDCTHRLFGGCLRIVFSDGAIIFDRCEAFRAAKPDFLQTLAGDPRSM
jgi:hypothetical protein